MCSEDEQVCAYSHDATLCNYSFLARLYVSSKSPICTWWKYTLAVRACVRACTRVM